MAFRIDGALHTCVAFSPTETLDMLELAQHVVVERFQTSGRLSGPGLETIELVGAIMGYCYARNIPLSIASPQMRYSHMRDAQAAVGVLIEPSHVAKHEVDALAHLLAWEYRNA